MCGLFVALLALFRRVIKKSAPTVSSLWIGSFSAARRKEPLRLLLLSRPSDGELTRLVC